MVYIVQEDIFYDWEVERVNLLFEKLKPVLIQDDVVDSLFWTAKAGGKFSVNSCLEQLSNLHSTE